MLKDPEGCYLLVVGTIEGETYTFVSYYAPSKGQARFFETLTRSLKSHFEGTVIFRGDSNTAFDLALDKSKGGKSKAKRPPRQSLKLVQLLHSLGLVDIWRELNPHGKDYTHFSATHNTYALIDHIFLQSSSIPIAIASKIRGTLLWDHSIMTLSIQWLLGLKGSFKWRLNEALLIDLLQCTILENALPEYFTNNDSVTPETLWAAHKAVIRGTLIQITSGLKHERRHPEADRWRPPTEHAT